MTTQPMQPLTVQPATDFGGIPIGTDGVRALTERSPVGRDSVAVLTHLRLTLASLLLLEGRAGDAVREAEAVLDEPDVPAGVTEGAELARLLGLLAQDDLARANGVALGMHGSDANNT